MRPPVPFLLASALAVSASSVSSRAGPSDSVNALLKRANTSPSNGSNEIAVNPGKRAGTQEPSSNSPATPPAHQRLKPQSPVNRIHASTETWQIIDNDDHPEKKFQGLYQLHVDRKIGDEELGAALKHAVSKHELTSSGVEYLRGLMTDVHKFRHKVFSEDDWEIINGNRPYSSNKFRLAPKPTI